MWTYRHYIGCMLKGAYRLGLFFFWILKFLLSPFPFYPLWAKILYRLIVFVYLVFNCTRKRIPFELILILNQNELDGVVLVDSDYIKDRKVYGHVLAAFRYGREDLDVLGLTFRKDLYLASSQIFPPEPNNKRTPTRLQVLMKQAPLICLQTITIQW